jgi:hypothetical protein
MYQVGYYRTRYPASMLSQLVTAVRDGSLPPLDRLGLLDDCFALVQAGLTHTADVSLIILYEDFAMFIISMLMSPLPGYYPQGELVCYVTISLKTNRNK